MLAFVPLLALLGTFLGFHLFFESGSFRAEERRQCIHIIPFLLRFCLISALLIKHFLLASGFLFGQDSGLCVSVWLSAAVLKLTYFLIQSLFGLKVVVSETDDFLADLLSRL